MMGEKWKTKEKQGQQIAIWNMVDINSIYELSKYTN